ncbi:hypothetical protein BO94DRAFT_588279 [Aspergillus sclerotioniger CBS 115572]|uniref:Uncharacterized protein n=1 Tax=Aspergillus sclerotioniger CBS 115572 TaxID=1450535 RepID=A0A317VZY3_9EURO|nr:hypothetical protein BO94DRAFT_588279 [Aspergillus sclerotioniger CBS 115572]PWY78562.1 hypothetical protein BO94DRAFT_588279 [Aspergillus sclerotioniger CBS 115572]
MTLFPYEAWYGVMVSRTEAGGVSVWSGFGFISFSTIPHFAGALDTSSAGDRGQNFHSLQFVFKVDTSSVALHRVVERLDV